MQPQTFRRRMRTALGVAVLLVALALGTGVFRRGVGAQETKAALLSEAAIRDAILGRAELSEAERQQFDLNEDGLLDVADLVAYLRLTDSSTPVAFFESVSSVTTEGTGVVHRIRVVFSHAYDGPLRYSVTAVTAMEGTDFAALPRTVQVNGPSTDIAVTLLDDADVEKVETLVLRLELDDGYAVEEPLEHTLFINDNDGAWIGAYVSEGSRMGFVMSITRSGDGYAGTLTSDGHGFLPEGEWPGDFEVAENTFQVTVSGIPVASGDTMLGASFTRTFVFRADPGQQPYVMDVDSVIIGQATETITPDDPSLAHLERINEGSFSLSRVKTELTPDEPSLGPVP